MLPFQCATWAPPPAQRQTSYLSARWQTWAPSSTAETSPKHSKQEERAEWAGAGEPEPQATRPPPGSHGPRSPVEAPSVAVCAPRNGGDRGRVAGRAPIITWPFSGKVCQLPALEKKRTPNKSEQEFFKNKNVAFPNYYTNAIRKS